MVQKKPILQHHQKSPSSAATKVVSRTPGRKSPVKAAAATKKTEKKNSSSSPPTMTIHRTNNKKSSPILKTKKSTPSIISAGNNNASNNNSNSNNNNLPQPVRPPLGLSAAGASNNSNNTSTLSPNPYSCFDQETTNKANQQLELSYTYHGQHPHGETGLGTTHIPFRQPLKDLSNNSACFHCPTDTCICVRFEEIMRQTISECDIRRETDGRPGRKDLCAKSLNSNFVSRLIREMNVESGDTFFDFGSGNGSILFQVAAQVPGVKCVGVELNGHNAELSKKLWSMIRPKLSKEFSSSKSSSLNSINDDEAVTIITGDALDLVAEKNFWKNATNPRTGKGPVILCNNVLWPRTTTHYLQERCRDAPLNTRICCFDDFFPHGRAVCQSRDPEAFELFEMRDYVWPLGAVEWSPSLEGKFFIHRKVKNREDLI